MIKTIAAAVLSAAILLPTVPAQADNTPLVDTRRCVSKREAKQRQPAGMTRPDLERKWEVRGKGVQTSNASGVSGIGSGWEYPMCTDAVPVGATDAHAFAIFKNGTIEYSGYSYIENGGTFTKVFL